MREEEVASVITEVYKGENWSFGIHDFTSAYKYDPTAFMLGEVNGEAVSTIMGLKWSPSYAYLSAYVVKPAHRKKGYGLKIFKEMMSSLGDRNIALSAVPGEDTVYQKSGFMSVYEESKCTGVAKHHDHPLHSRICDALKVPFEDLATYDRLHFPVPRDKFVDIWIHQPGAVAKTYVQDGKIQGYGVIKVGDPCPQIGPIYAANEEIANPLWSSLTNTFPPGQQYQIYLHMPIISLSFALFGYIFLLCYSTSH